MAIQTINIGNRVNDGLGDDLRTAFEKVNANFTDLSNSLTVTATNIGTYGEGVFASKVGSELQFKKLMSGNKIVLDTYSDSIRISSTQPDSFTRIETNSGFISSTDYQQIAIQGGENITVSASGAYITIDTNNDIGDLFSNFDFGPISNPENVIQLLMGASNIDFGTVGHPGEINIDLGSI
jgi:hypothetical protein